MTLSLAPLQQAFQEFVLGQRDAGALAQHVATRPGLGTDERLSIYFNAYRVRLREALSETYDKTHQYLGDELFYAASADYIAQNPSHTPNLRWYGAAFPAFLGNYLPEHPVLAELAAFEWTLSLAFDAEDQPLLALADLAQVQPEDWEHIGFACHASVHFLPLHSNCVAIWLALSEEEQAAAPPIATWQTTPQPWLIWRKNLQAHFRSLSDAEYQALRGLQAGQSFAAVCGAAVENAGDDDGQTQAIATWLQTWTGESVLHGIRRAPD